MNTLINYRNYPRSTFDSSLFSLFDAIGYPSLLHNRVSEPAFPKCDIEETEKHFVMSFDLPGVRKEDLNLDVKDGVLTLTGERKNETQKEGYSERFYGNFQRKFTLPEHSNTN